MQVQGDADAWVQLGSVQSSPACCQAGACCSPCSLADAFQEVLEAHLLSRLSCHTSSEETVTTRQHLEGRQCSTPVSTQRQTQCAALRSSHPTSVLTAGQRQTPAGSSPSRPAAPDPAADTHPSSTGPHAGSRPPSDPARPESAPAGPSASLPPSGTIRLSSSSPRPPQSQPRPGSAASGPPPAAVPETSSLGPGSGARPSSGQPRQGLEGLKAPRKSSLGPSRGPSLQQGSGRSTGSASSQPAGQSAPGAGVHALGPLLRESLPA